MHKVLYDILSFKHFRQWDGKRDSIPVTAAYLKPGRKSGKNTVQDQTCGYHSSTFKTQDNLIDYSKWLFRCSAQIVFNSLRAKTNQGSFCIQ